MILLSILLLFFSIAIITVEADTEDVVILSHSSFVDSIDYYHIVGEVRNVGSTNLKYVKITATFYDDNDTVVDTDFSYTTVEILQPGERSPFELTSSQTSSIDHYTIVVSSYSITTEQPYSDIQILNYSDFTDSIGYHHIVGEVQNTGTSNVEYVKIAAAYYNSSNNIIATGYAFTRLDILLPNQKSSFEISEKVTPYNYSIIIAGVDETTKIPYRDFQILSHSSYIDSIGFLHVAGEVKNVGAKNTTYVKIIGTFYDLSGTVVETDFAYADPHELIEDQQAPFELTALYQVNKIDQYTLQVQCFEFDYLSSSSISCSVLPTSIDIGSNITVSGAITPARSGVTVTLSYTLPNVTVIERNATTTINGEYSDIYTPSVVGSWSVEASWSGDSMYSGSASGPTSFSVNKISCIITCGVSSSSLTIGDSIMVYGSITPALSGITIDLGFTSPNSSVIERTLVTNSSGGYNDTFTPSATGTWSVKVSWEEDSVYYGASSSDALFTVYDASSAKNESSITCILSETSITYGSTVSISGNLTDFSTAEGLAGRIIRLEYSIDGGSAWIKIAERLTVVGGEFSYVWSPDSGHYYIRAGWSGDDAYEAVTSSSVELLVETETLNVWTFEDESMYTDYKITVVANDTWEVGTEQTMKLIIEVTGTEEGRDGYLRIESIEMGVLLCTTTDTINETLHVGDSYTHTTEFCVTEENYGIYENKAYGKTLSFTIEGRSYYRSYTGEMKSTSLYDYESWSITVQGVDPVMVTEWSATSVNQGTLIIVNLTVRYPSGSPIEGCTASITIDSQTFTSIYEGDGVYSITINTKDLVGTKEFEIHVTKSTYYDYNLVPKEGEKYEISIESPPSIPWWIAGVVVVAVIAVTVTYFSKKNSALD